MRLNGSLWTNSFHLTSLSSTGSTMMSGMSVIASSVQEDDEEDKT